MVPLEVTKLSLFTAELFWEFRALAGLKGSTSSNDVLRRGQEIYASLKKFEAIPWVLGDSDALFRKDISLINHPVFIAVIGYNQFRMSFMCQLLYHRHLLLGGDREADVVESTDCLLRAQQCALELFKTASETQRRYGQVFAPHLDMVYFLIEIGHVFNFSIPFQPFASNSSKSSQKMVSLWKDKLISVSQICPIFAKSWPVST